MRRRLPVWRPVIDLWSVITRRIISAFMEDLFVMKWPFSPDRRGNGLKDGHLDPSQ